MYEKSIINYYVNEFIYNVDFASISSGSNIKELLKKRKWGFF